MSVSRRVASGWLKRLDRCANVVQHRASELGMDENQSRKLASKIDSISDAIQRTVYGDKEFKKYQANVLERDTDEGYMKTFDDTGVIESDNDESYMKDFGQPEGKGKNQWEEVNKLAAFARAKSQSAPANYDA